MAVGTTVGAGIRLDVGGSVTNQGGASIGGYVGIRGGSLFGLTIATAGAILGSQYAVSFGNASNRLIIDPGAIFVGQAESRNLLDVSTMELSSSATAATLTGRAAQFFNFAQLAVAAGATWTPSGPNAVSTGTTLTNAGTLLGYGDVTDRFGAIECCQRGNQRIKWRAIPWVVPVRATIVNAGLFASNSASGSGGGYSAAAASPTKAAARSADSRYHRLPARPPWRMPGRSRATQRRPSGHAFNLPAAPSSTKAAARSLATTGPVQARGRHRCECRKPHH